MPTERKLQSSLPDKMREQTRVTVTVSVRNGRMMIVFAHGEVKVQDHYIFNHGLKRNETTIYLEMLIARDACSGASTKCYCLGFVVVEFEFVGIHPNFDMLDTLLCLFNKKTKLSRRGNIEKLCIV